MLAKLASLTLFAAPLASTGLAQVFVPTDASRFVSASAEIDFAGGTYDSEIASGFTPFTESAAAQDSGTNSLAVANSYQDSSFTGSGFLAQGWTSAATDGSTSEASARSSFLLDFDLTQPSMYTVSGEVSALEDGSSIIILTSGSSVIFAETADGPSESRSFSSSGFLPSGQYKIQLFANDNIFSSAAIGTAAATFSLNIDFQPAGATDCVPLPNSTGSSSVLVLIGGNSISSPADSPTLLADRLPAGQFGLFFYGDLQPAVPFGDGVLCIGPALYRFPSPLVTNSSGAAIQAIPFGAPPLSGGGPGAIQAGSSWTFQFWHRDAGPLSTGWNTSSAVTVPFTN